VLESFYEVPREEVARLMRSAIALPAIETVDAMSLIRALEVYEVDLFDFAEAYLVAQAEADRRRRDRLIRAADRSSRKRDAARAMTSRRVSWRGPD
jgi:hypothetical protein